MNNINEQSSLIPYRPQHRWRYRFQCYLVRRRLRAAHIVIGSLKRRWNDNDATLVLLAIVSYLFTRIDWEWQALVDEHFRSPDDLDLPDMIRIQIFVWAIAHCLCRIVLCQSVVDPDAAHTSRYEQRTLSGGMRRTYLRDDYQYTMSREETLLFIITFDLSRL